MTTNYWFLTYRVTDTYNYFWFNKNDFSWLGYPN